MLLLLLLLRVKARPEKSRCRPLAPWSIHHALPSLGGGFRGSGLCLWRVVM